VTFATLVQGLAIGVGIVAGLAIGGVCLLVAVEIAGRIIARINRR
jgi:hypothetical protein